MRRKREFRSSANFAHGSVVRGFDFLSQRFYGRRVRAVLAQVIGGQMVPVHLIAVEKKEPFRCGVWRVSDDTLAIAQRENEAAIRRLLVCRQKDQWPTGYEEIRVLDVAWACLHARAACGESHHAAATPRALLALQV